MRPPAEHDDDEGDVKARAPIDQEDAVLMRPQQQQPPPTTTRQPPERQRQLQRQRQRLRGVAQYMSLGPQALACSGPVVVSSSTVTAPPAAHGTTTSSKKMSSPSYIGSGYEPDERLLRVVGDVDDPAEDGYGSTASSLMLASSLGAVAGNRGVAVFSMHQPHRPKLVLSLVSTNSSPTTTSSSAVAASTGGRTSTSTSTRSRNNMVSSLAFQPVGWGGGAAAAAAAAVAAEGPMSSTSQLYLAAARGDSVLVWDVSGHSLSPLWGRWSARGRVSSSSMTSTENYDDHYTRIGGSNIVDLCWHSAGPGGGTKRSQVTAASPVDRYDCLLALTLTHACLWDVRAPPSSSSSSPSGLRFAFGATMASSSSPTDGPRSPLVQVASQGHECAIMNQSGCLYVYDTRMVATSTSSASHINASGGATAIVPAFHYAGVGVAAYHSSATSNGTDWMTWGIDSSTSLDDGMVKVWSIDGTMMPVNDDDRGHGGYRLMGTRTIPNLCCARIGPAPFQDSIVTVAMEGSADNEVDGSSWTAQLWNVPAAEKEEGSTTPELESLATFRTTSSNDGTLLGRLCASELAALVAVRPTASKGMMTASRGSTQFDGMGDDEERDEVANRSVLLLCSLMDAGYVTTHEIPEAIPSSSFRSRSGDFGRARRLLPNLGVDRQGLRVYPVNKEAPVGDAAGAWSGDPVRRDAPERPGAGLLLPWQQHEGTAATIGPAADGAGGGAQLPFDMDFSALAVVANDDGDKMGTVEVSHAATLNADTDPSTKSARVAADLMQRIETDRIPCPRLCGATFGPGIGGLVSFNNGDIRRMWSWWERTDPARSASSGAPGIVGELLLSDNSPDSSSSKLVKRGCPRTLKDLIDMTVAAKEAQWGDQDDSEASSTGFHAPGPSFFEEGSVGSTESGDDDDDEGPGDKDLYDSYFGESQRPLLEGGPSNRVDPEDVSPDKKAGEPYGPSSDSLAPVVRLSRQFEKLAMSSQRIELAKAWELGPIIHGDFVPDVANGVAPKLPKPSSDENATTPNRPSSRGRLPVSSGLPPYRFLVPPSQPTTDRFQRASSDPQLPRGSNLVAGDADDERGVHGGDYGVRPNMQESMVFLRKLFTHQQDGGSHFPALYSPPDGPMLPNSRSEPAAPAMSALVVPPIADPKRGRPKKPVGSGIGLYTVQASDQERGNLPKSRWKDVERACRHNAMVCQELGDDVKRSVWELLAKAVAIRSNDDETTNTFGPFAGGGYALGRRLVSNILRYYEVQGDVQMLATIVCVLQAGTAVQASGKCSLAPSAALRRHWSLLPQDQPGKFDMYIRRYGDILFAWGLLTTRAELNKHLTSASFDFEVEHAASKGLGSTTALLPSFVCPRCSRATAGSSFCDTCNMFAFRCVICDNSVRGLFSSCPSCGHGGHMAHMQQWFASHDECPTGCGCVCTSRKGSDARAAFTAHAKATHLSQEPPSSAVEDQFDVNEPAVDSTRPAELYAT